MAIKHVSSLESVGMTPLLDDFEDAIRRILHKVVDMVFLNKICKGQIQHQEHPHKQSIKCQLK